jgi:protein-S-isoprenylcysteine O-methyltransferase Ste14
MEAGAMGRKFALIYIAAAIIIGLALFAPAGTLDYWQAWAYLAVVLLPAALVVAYFLKKDPEFLERRLRTREKEATQGRIIKAGTAIFAIAFLIPGLDRRFGWSAVPVEISVAADALVFLGYIFVFLVFRANSYAGRTVQVDAGQKVVTTGPYAIVRHPMYLGSLVLYLATPLALGSYVAVPLFLLGLVPVFVFRILNEEEVLRRELPGYEDYCMKTRYRLVPFVW